MFHRKVEFMLVPAQWPSSRTAHWSALMRARAIENQCFVIGANRCGREAPLRGGKALEFPGGSELVDPSGEVVGHGGADEAVVIAELPTRQIRTMSRLLPIRKDSRLDTYRRLWS
jgi:predicted amidohydrolase